MSEENFKNTTIPEEDLDVLRVVLHNTKGSSAVSTTREYIPVDTSQDE